MKDKEKLWEKAKKDFPCDPALQEVHYARLKIHEQAKEMTDREYVEFIKIKAKKVIGGNTEKIKVSP